MLETRDLCSKLAVMRSYLGGLRQARGPLCGSTFPAIIQGIVIRPLPTLQGRCRIGGDDKCMRSMLKNPTCHANVRYYQISDLNFLLRGLAFLRTRQHICKKLAHSRWAGSRSCPRLMPLILHLLPSGRSKVLPAYLSTPFPPPALFLTTSSHSPKFRQVRLLLPFLHSFLGLSDMSCLFLWSGLSCCH